MSGEFTTLLNRVRSGDRTALEELMPAVYDELHRLAARQLSRERPSHTLQPTALVNEAYIRLFGERTPEAKDRRHFIGIAARVMRQVLVDYARSRSSLKRSGVLVSLEPQAPVKDAAADVLHLNASLDRLAAEDPALVRLIEMRFFGGMTADEIAEVEGESVHVVRHNLRYARAWLRRDLNPGSAENGSATPDS